jgi:hypothetical protein
MEQKKAFNEYLPHLHSICFRTDRLAAGAFDTVSSDKAHSFAVSEIYKVCRQHNSVFRWYPYDDVRCTQPANSNSAD